MNALPTTGELFATNQVSPETECCYKYQLRSFAKWMADSRDVHDMEDVTTAATGLQTISTASSWIVAETLSSGHKVLLRMGAGCRDNSNQSSRILEASPRTW